MKPPSHEWIRIEGDVAIVGISSAAASELGEIVYVELPKIGQQVQEGEAVVVLESTKAAADVYSPASGYVVAINEELQTTPSLINRFAESRAWLYTLRDSP